MNKIICANLPDPNEEMELWNLVGIFQIHRYSKTCRRYCNEKFRFYFGKYFTGRTIIAKPLPNDIPEKMEARSNERKKILRKEKKGILTQS